HRAGAPPPRPVANAPAAPHGRGPHRGPRGYHFIRVDEVIPRQPLRYEDIRSQVREDWSAMRRNASIEQRLEVLRANYAIREL
ncbi:MAG: hypothetical protein JJT88_07315, partial [Gammaproteobacteria bacterium]|nr:hypothetical protein [Gammaproteobacteria bacterium]